MLIEKPHRLPGQDPAALVAAAGRAGAVAQVGMTTRFGAGLRAARRAIVDGQLGRVVWVEDRIWFRALEGDLAPWYFDRAVSGGGVLLTNGVHALDRVEWLLDEQLELIDADLQTLVAGRSVEDAVRLRLRSASGAEVTISLLWAPYPVPTGELRITGTDGQLTARPDGSWTHERPGVALAGAGPESALMPFTRQWDAFRAAIAGEALPDPGVATVERSIATIEQIYRERGLA